jgi:parvulin-like peptidyl-prolyl isomerase
MRRRIHVLLLLTVLLGILAGCGEATSPIMARVGNTNITEAQFTEYMEKNKGAFDPAASQGRSPEQIRHDLFLQMINEEVALEEARRNGYGIDSESAQRSAVDIEGFVRQNSADPNRMPTIAQIDAIAKEKNYISYAEIRKLVTHISTLNSFAQQIELEGAPQQSFLTEAFVPLINPDQSEVTPDQVETGRQEAAAMAAQLRGGADISDVTAKYASDPQASQMQGELGWVDVAGPGPEFAAAADALPLNQWSDPIRSGMGWHVIKITERRIATAGSWQELMSSPQGQQLMAAKVQEYKDKGEYQVFIDPASIPTPSGVTEQQ